MQADDQDRRSLRRDMNPSAGTLTDEARARRQRETAGVIMQRLSAARRLSAGDRALLVTNLGRLVEQAFRGAERAAARRVFETAYPDNADYVQSLLKKRGRYMLFSDEPLPEDPRDGIFAARGETYVLLLRAFCTLRHDGPPADLQLANALEQLVRGSSFEDSSPTFVQSGMPPDAQLRSLFRQVVARIDTACDLVGFFREISWHSVSALLEPLDEWRGREHSEFRAVKGVQYRDAGETPAGLPDPKDFLLPAVRIARSYWPRDFLCLPDCFEASRLEGIDSERGRMEVVEAFAREQGLEGVDWSDFEDPLSGDACRGAFYRTFYEGHSIDLMIGCGTGPEDLVAGLFTSLWEGHAPGDDDLITSPAADTARDRSRSARALEGLYAFEDEAGYVQLGDRIHLARSVQQHGERHLEHREDGPPEVSWSESRWFAADWGHFADRLLPLESRDGWQLLTWPAAPADSFFNLFDPPLNGRELPVTAGRRHRAGPGGRIGVRACIAAPEGPVNAPENSLAALLMRNLAYGDGPGRIDNRLMAAAQVLTQSLRSQRADRVGQFEQALRARGFRL